MSCSGKGVYIMALNPHDLTKNEAAGKLGIGNGIVPDNEAATSLNSVALQTGLTDSDDFLDALAATHGYERLDPSTFRVTRDLVKQIQPQHAMRYKVFPVRFDEDSLWLAMADPLNIMVTDDLARITGKRIIPVVATEDDVKRLISMYYEATDIDNMYNEIADKAIAEEAKKIEALEEDEYSEAKLAEKKQEVPPVVKYVDMLFKEAVHERASDIHVEPSKTGITVRYRIDGVLHDVPAPPKRWQNSILSRLKVLSGMDLAEKRIPLDGRIRLDIPGRNLDVRVSSLPAIYGESIVMRILDQASVLMGLGDVGFLPDSIEIFESLIHTPNGVILMTGPTGSGKTTTLYAALSTINNPETKIVTVEDPVEYMIDGINQVQVNKEVDLDFAQSLRSILRQSPDVIMVGEMRDLETAEVGISAALTGHLVFSTLHTNDAPSACTRLIDMGVKPFLVASSLQAVIAQRLVRRICASCKQAYKPTVEELKNLGYSPEVAQGKAFYAGKGCERCNAGYRGRTAIHEIMCNHPELRQMIIRTEPASRLKKAAIRLGMRTLRMDGWEKILLGQTTAQEVLRMTAEDTEE